jgi:PII-like signaling protein
MKLAGKNKRLTIFIGESDKVGHTPLYDAIVKKAHSLGIAGASVIKCVEGYGASSHIHTTRILTLSEDLPIMIVIIDSQANIDKLLPYLDEVISEGIVVIDDVEVYKYSGRNTNQH